MSVKFGAKPIEFEKGKAGIAVPSKDKLPTVINTLIEAVVPVRWTISSQMPAIRDLPSGRNRPIRQTGRAGPSRFLGFWNV